MTDINIQPLDFIANVLRSDDSDPIKEMLALFAQVLMHHDANAQCGAQFRGRSDERVNQRNGYRTRRWDTRAGTIDLNIPKLRRGSYYPGIGARILSTPQSPLSIRPLSPANQPQHSSPRAHLPPTRPNFKPEFRVPKPQRPPTPSQHPSSDAPVHYAR